MKEKGKFQRWLSSVKKDIGTKIVVTVLSGGILALGGWGYEIPKKAENGQRAIELIPGIERRLDTVFARVIRIEQSRAIDQKETSGIKEDIAEIKEWVRFLYEDAYRKKNY